MNKVRLDLLWVMVTRNVIEKFMRRFFIDWLSIKNEYWWHNIKWELLKKLKTKELKLSIILLLACVCPYLTWQNFGQLRRHKIHTCWGDALMIPDMINISEAKIHDRYGLTQLVFPKNTIIIEDRAYFDIQLMLNRIQAENVFVTRIKDNTIYYWIGFIWNRRPWYSKGRNHLT